MNQWKERMRLIKYMAKDQILPNFDILRVPHENWTCQTLASLAMSTDKSVSIKSASYYLQKCKKSSAKAII
jgi:hypothetical protein